MENFKFRRGHCVDQYGRGYRQTRRRNTQYILSFDNYSSVGCRAFIYFPRRRRCSHGNRRPSCSSNNIQNKFSLTFVNCELHFHSYKIKKKNLPVYLKKINSSDLTQKFERSNIFLRRSSGFYKTNNADNFFLFRVDYLSKYFSI